MRLQQLADEQGVRIAHRAFVLRPQDDEGAAFTDYHLQHRFAARLRMGLPYGVPAVGTRYPRSSWPALEAAKWVEDEHPDRLTPFDAAVFSAFFEHTRDISDPDVLVDIAQTAGIAPHGLADALAARTYRGAVAADHQEAMARGITGIPAVLIGGQIIAGAVPYETYESALRRAPRQS